MNDKRNYGIDLLRIVAMFLIVMVHVIEHNNLTEIFRGGVNGIILCIEIICYCAVDCYALISGYVGYAAKPSAQREKIFERWLQCIFYNFGITVIFILLNQIDSKGEIVKSLFPVSTETYWYFTAYFILYFFEPLIVQYIESLDFASFRKLFKLVLLIFCCYGSLVGVSSDPIHLVWGYSFIWLFVLYIIGAGVNKFNLFDNFSKKKLMIGIATCYLFNVVSKFTIQYVSTVLLGRKFGDMLFIEYISPTTLLISIMLLALFRKIYLRGFLLRMVKILAPTTLGVYFFHEQKYIKQFLNKKIVIFISEIPTATVPFALMLSVTLIFLVGALVDIFRSVLFKMVKGTIKRKGIENG
jgi:surface polysaccharide O-acyltransferase-like enzyme